MGIIEVNAKKSYNVWIKAGLTNGVQTLLSNICDFDSVCIITDSNVAPLYLDKLAKQFEESGKKVLSFVFPAGEKSKNLSTFASATSFLAKNDFKRSDLIVALGGGVVGDLAGFVASAYHRGVKFAQLPTTLLAGIDSSVGGKTAVDIPEGKNLVGAFYQPVAVYFDTDTLSTLPEKELTNGYGELVKYGILSGGELWSELTNERTNLKKSIELSVRYKADIVQKDEFDNGVRALLNLGHTIAHSVENLSNYTVPHGIAVGYGISRIAKACYKNGILPYSDYEKITETLNKFGLDYDAPFSTQDLVEEAFRDKKTFADKINLIIIESIGNCKIKTFKLDELEKFFND